jgi:hypothetical protein
MVGNATAYHIIGSEVQQPAHHCITTLQYSTVYKVGFMVEIATPRTLPLYQVTASQISRSLFRGTRNRGKFLFSLS